MNFFDPDQILAIAEKAIALGLVNQRDALMAGLHPGFLATLPTAAAPQSQLILDLNEMNRTPSIEGVIPLEHWLRTASFLVSFRPAEQRFFRDRADAVAGKSDLGPLERAGGADIAATLLPTVDEKIIAVSDLLPFEFLAAAARTGNAIARLIVPSIENGTPRTKPFSSQPLTYFGTGWLIGPRHVITNHHVINARSPGEGAAARADLERQASGTTVQFDYDGPEVPGTPVFGVMLAADNEGLDYAILELPAASDRTILPIWGGPFALDGDDALPVNVIQHPGGSPKQLGIRNNLAARLTDKDLAYFTDTEGGSSGSPVCSDDWIVLALHKASTTVFGKLEFQGKKTAWVNVGTRVDLIIEDLEKNHAALWSAIGADIRR